MIHLFPPPPPAAGRRRGRQLDAARWGVVCKAAAAVAVSEGHITADEACDLCRMDRQELEVWDHVVRDHGLRRMFAGRL